MECSSLCTGTTIDSVYESIYWKMLGEGDKVALIFRLRRHRFDFRAVGSVYFPRGKAGNVLRGALGPISTAFKSKRPNLPSGLAEPPRPFVLRASHLDGKCFGPGEMFSFEMNVFDLRASSAEALVQAVSRLEDTGLGPRRGRVEFLRPVTTTDIELDLGGTPDQSANRVTVLFRTPTALKGTPSRFEAPFGILFARIRDRISTLRSLYGEGPLPVDFKALSLRADLVRTLQCELLYHDVSRRSSRTGTVHKIGGFTGTAEYEGEVAEFFPWLQAAWWTGVGRYTVWGNGVIEIVVR
jgi:hypothetical protein